MKSTAGMARALLVLCLASNCLVADDKPNTSSPFETRLLGVWKLWSSEPKPQPTSCRLLQIDFQTNAFVRWATRCDGKTTEQTGRYSIEISANLYHRGSLTHVIRIQTTGSPPETVFHLVGVHIGSDNRVPIDAEVLKFKDAFVSEFVFIKENGQSARRD